MGGARWSDTDWVAHKSATSGKTRGEIFTETHLIEALDPAKFKFRECVASIENPHPTPILLGSDVTGSVGELAEQIVKEGLGTIMHELYERKPVPDPQIACAAIGDVECDSAPLQVTQFEASMSLTEQLKQVYVEGGGGGNDHESYPALWAFALAKVKADAMRKEGRKGYIFTIGDEQPCMTLSRDHLKKFLNLNAQADMDARLLVEQLSPDWNVFHLIVKPVTSQPVERTWRSVLGPRALYLKDHTRLAEAVVALIQFTEGWDLTRATRGWSSSSELVVKDMHEQLRTR